ncbi:MAG: hypothetical protein GY889_09460, partial [Proteobacteria bacterium]|nr:hypothetical protein [Pseudomonadota bacterium]
MTSLCDAAGVLTKEELLADAKGWYDTTPSTFKTDLVASFDSANSETLLINDASQSGLDWGVGDFTLSIWFSPDSIAGFKWVGGKGAGGGASAGIAIYRSSAGLYVRVADGTVSRSSLVKSGLTIGAWYHIVMLREAGVVKYFEAGSEVGAGVSIPGSVDNLLSFSISSFGGSTHNDQKSAHWANWNRALTSAEITTLYNGGTMQAIPDELKPGGVSYWPLDEPRGTRYDRWWGGNHLTDNNTVGAAHGPVEHVAEEYAGVTRWLNQGLAADGHDDLVLDDGADGAPQLIGGILHTDGITNNRMYSAGGFLTRGLTLVCVFAANQGHLINSNDGANECSIRLSSRDRYQVASGGNTLNILDVDAPDYGERLVMVARFYDGQDMEASINGGPWLSTPGKVALEDHEGLTILATRLSGSKLSGTFEAVLGFDRILTSAENAAIVSLFADTTPAAPTVAGDAPTERFDLTDDVIALDTSAWFAGTVDRYDVDNLPQGLWMDVDTGIISGTITGATESLTVTVTATNRGGSVAHAITWDNFDAYGDAKGWYDTTASTLKTDLVASFDSANSESLRKTAPHNLGVTTGGYSLAMWVKIDSVASGGGGLASIYGIVGERSLVFQTRVSDGFIRVVFRDESDVAFVRNGTTNVCDNAWHHVGFTLDGSTVRLYVDGVEDATIAQGAIAAPGAAPFALGRYSSIYHEGEMAHAAVWNRALSAGEFGSLYDSGSMAMIPESLETGGVSYWPLWEPRGIRYDRWGSNHLTDFNTVGVAHGPVEVQAGEYAGVTRWENQGLAASPFADVVTPTAIKSPQLLNGLLTWDGVNSASLYSATGTVSPDSAIYVVARADSDGPAGAGLVDSDNSTNRHLIYLVSNYLRVIASSGDRALTTNDGHDRFGLYAEYTTTSITAKVGGETFIDSSASPGDMIGLSIGGYFDQSTTGSWDGTIEAVLVFDRVLTSAELASLESLYSPAAPTVAGDAPTERFDLTDDVIALDTSAWFAGTVDRYDV